MNGRVYDPTTGRFLSADNVVQAPGFTQSYNRYSYCMNNPLKYTDPTGYEDEYNGGMPSVHAPEHYYEWSEWSDMVNSSNPWYTPNHAMTPSEQMHAYNQENAAIMAGVNRRVDLYDNSFTVSVNGEDFGRIYVKPGYSCQVDAFVGLFDGPLWAGDYVAFKPPKEKTLTIGFIINITATGGAGGSFSLGTFVFGGKEYGFCSAGMAFGLEVGFSFNPMVLSVPSDFDPLKDFYGIAQSYSGSIGLLAGSKGSSMSYNYSADEYRPDGRITYVSGGGGGGALKGGASYQMTWTISVWPIQPLPKYPIFPTNTIPE